LRTLSHGPSGPLLDQDQNQTDSCPRTREQAEPIPTEQPSHPPQRRHGAATTTHKLQALNKHAHPPPPYSRRPTSPPPPLTSPQPEAQSGSGLWVCGLAFLAELGIWIWVSFFASLLGLVGTAFGRCEERACLAWLMWDQTPWTLAPSLLTDSHGLFLACLLTGLFLPLGLLGLFL